MMMFVYSMIFLIVTALYLIKIKELDERVERLEKDYEIGVD